MKSTPIILAADHAGYKLKEEIKAFLTAKGYKTDDMGAHAYVEDDDYPSFMAQAAIRVAQDTTGHARAIIFGKSGQGEAIVANRFPGVRAVVYYGSSHDILRLSREHNDANILSIGAGFVNEAEAKEAVIQWLDTPFSGEERHQRRIDEIDSIS
jgi:ribose 5-phosphate isomerase B